MMLLILDENPILAANLVPSKLKFKQLLELSQLICSAGISGVYKKIPQGEEIQNWILENPAWIYRYFDTLFIYCVDLPNIKHKTVEDFKQIMHDLHWHVKFNDRIYIPHKQQYSDLVKIISLIILIMLHYLLVNVWKNIKNMYNGRKTKELNNMRKINVLSLFDGISCGRVALQRAGIPVNKYCASEIDKYAIMITQNNFPDTVQLGDVTKWEDWDIDWGSIDLLIGGNPCVSWSVAGKQLGTEDPRGQLLFDYVNILRHIQKYNPNVKFLVENVKMKREFQDIFSNMLGVQPVEINSALVSAQNRKRLYWTNWEFGQPEDKHIILKDIVHEYSKVERDKAICLNEYIVPFDKTLQILDKEVERGKVGYFGKDSQANRVYYIHDKAVTLCGSAGGGAAKMGQYLFGVVNKPRVNNNGGLRYDGKKSPTLTSNSWEHNNHLLFGCLTPDRVNKRQNGQRFNEGDKFYTLTAQDKHGILVEGYIRKLTPVECERLQTLEDGFTANGIDQKTGKVVPISNTQRYKALGNGWTVDVIAHILKSLDFGE